MTTPSRETGESVYPDEVSLTVTLRNEAPSAADLASLVESLDALVAAPLWPLINDPDADDPILLSLRNVVSEATSPQKGRRRFWPEFYEGTIAPTFNRRAPEQGLPPNFDPSDPLDTGLQVGLNSFLRRVVRQRDPDLYRQTFSTVRIARLEHHSPILVELAMALGGSFGLTTVFIYGLMRAAVRCRREEAEARIREIEADDRAESAKQNRIRTVVLEEFAEAVRAQRAAGKLETVPDSVMAAMVSTAAPAIADLATSPLIGSVSLGLTTKA